METETLIEAAIRFLNTSDPHEKARLGDSIAVKWLQGDITEPYDPTVDLPVPDRPARLTNDGGDNETTDLLERVVYPEEITHCAAGVKWFKYLCARSKDPEFTINNKESDDCNEEIIKKFSFGSKGAFQRTIETSF